MVYVTRQCPARNQTYPLQDLPDPHDLLNLPDRSIRPTQPTRPTRPIRPILLGHQHENSK